jgi:hypothetical protein
LWVYSNEIDVAATPLHGFKAGAQATVGVGFEAQARQGHDVAPEKRAGVYRVATLAGLAVDMW